MQVDTTWESAPSIDVETPGKGRTRSAIRAWAALAARPVAVYLASRAVVTAALWLASRMPPPDSIGDLVTFWDGSWYIQTARAGYPNALPMLDGHVAQSTFAFFPLFPLCVRAVHFFGFSYLAAGLIVSGAAGIVTVVLLCFLLRRTWGEESADRSVALFCFFPGAFVLSGTYAEPLMLALAIGSLLSLLNHRWLLAGLLAALAGATTSHALALVPACAWAAAIAIRRRREWKALLAPLLGPLGFVAFQVFLWSRTGVPDAYMQTHHAWGVRPDAMETWDHFRDFFRQPFSDANVAVVMIGTVILGVTLVLLVRARPPGPVLIYTVCVMIPVMVSETLGARPRFLLTAFPLVAVLGHRLRGNGFAGVLAASATLLGCLTVVSVKTALLTP